MLLDLRKQTTKPLQCQDCDIDVQFLASVRFRRVFRSTITKRKFFLCPNCGRLSSAVVAICVRGSGSIKASARGVRTALGAHRSTIA